MKRQIVVAAFALVPAPIVSSWRIFEGPIKRTPDQCIERMRKGQAVNAFERHFLDSWSECAALLGRRDFTEFERRVDALIAVLERCQDRAWIVAAC